VTALRQSCSRPGAVVTLTAHVPVGVRERLMHERAPKCTHPVMRALFASVRQNLSMPPAVNRVTSAICLSLTVGSLTGCIGFNKYGFYCTEGPTDVAQPCFRNVGKKPGSEPATGGSARNAEAPMGAASQPKMGQ
jgi:hypothetical protein